MHRNFITNEDRNIVCGVKIIRIETSIPCIFMIIKKLLIRINSRWPPYDLSIITYQLSEENA